MSKTIHILHTNDLHSQFARMPHIATCLKIHRQQWEAQGDLVLTIDIGDHLDRMNVKTEATWGQANVDVLNKSGYQYVTIGNNEGLTLPKEQLDHLYRRAGFTVVLGNLLEPQAGDVPSWAVPYAIHEWNECRIALFGVTAPFTSFYQLLGWEMREPFSFLQEQIQAVRREVDVVVVLSHLGLHEDRRMAEEIQGIDVILGGHTHHVLEKGERLGSTLIAQVGRFGEYVGHVRLELDAAQKVVAAGAELFPSVQYPPDLELLQVLQQEREAAEQVLAEKVVELETDLEIDWLQETPFGSFLAASLRRWTNAEIGLANGGLLLSPLKRGTVTRKDLLACVPHPINPCAVTLTGEQLQRVLQRAVQPDFVQSELRGFGFRGKIAGWMGIDGLKVHYRESAEREIVQVWVNGEPLQLTRTYRVGTIDMFMFNRRLLPELVEGCDHQFYLPEVLREVFALTLHDKQLLKASRGTRWERLQAD